MNLINYLAFIKVCELRSITKTAKELGYSQPGISHMLEALESDMGFPLLIRSKTSVTPTEDGRKILPYCYQIVKSEEAMHQMADSINGLLDGNIRIGSLNSLLVNFTPKVVRKFTNVYSNIDISLQEESIPGIIKKLHSNEVDIGFTSQFEEKGLDFIPLFKDPLCLIMSDQHHFASYEKISAKDLNGCDFIMPMEGWDDMFLAVMEAEPFTPHIKHYIASDTGGIAMTAENLGVFIIPKLQSSLLPGNVLVKEFSKDIYRTLGIGIRSLSKATPSLKKFIEMSQELVNK